jgi:hypothetical protein
MLVFVSLHSGIKVHHRRLERERVPRCVPSQTRHTIIMRVRVYQLFIECAHVYLLSHIQRKGLCSDRHCRCVILLLCMRERDFTPKILDI